MDEELKDLLQRILCKDPERRIKIPEIWEHAWVRKGYKEF